MNREHDNAEQLQNTEKKYWQEHKKNEPWLKYKDTQVDRSLNHKVHFKNFSIKMQLSSQ